MFSIKVAFDFWSKKKRKSWRWRSDLRLKTDHITNAVTLVTDGGADLSDGVDELNTEHPLGRSKLNLTSEVVDVLDQRAQDHASTLGGLGAHAVDHGGSKGGVELAGRHCV